MLFKVIRFLKEWSTFFGNCGCLSQLACTSTKPMVPPGNSRKILSGLGGTQIGDLKEWSISFQSLVTIHFISTSVTALLDTKTQHKIVSYPEILLYSAHQTNRSGVLSIGVLTFDFKILICIYILSKLFIVASF